MKKGIFKMGISQIVFNYLFYILIFAVAFLCYMVTRDVISKTGSTVYYVDLIIGLSMMKKIILVFAAIPYTASFCDDWNNRYINSVLMRCGVKKYSIFKIGICFLSSFLVILLGMTLFIIAMSFKYPIITNGFKASLPYKEVAESAPLIYLYIRVIIFSLGLSFWCVVGMTASAYIPNKYVAICSPIIFSYLLEELTGFLPRCLDIYHLTRASNVINQGALVTFLYTMFIFIVLIAICILIFKNAVKRRMSNELI